ncbi:hypothetical protein ATO6_01200 [Oceanicola sp. 22II-s10i]|uniref:hypothetical protein n=1 Tax=Oceanicola sp. 22II-s10i TaxID=1317116 RepID=UPI000B51F477|nr:hypothetical protein [Oceanicola sp. 22II-s10i]OWU85581.1 hypothetical protein ATO6_01200 [Oceanicola sp. 22II-s10i]
MTLTLLHTAEAHVATFSALRDRIAPGAALNQHVRADWLAEARDRGVSSDLAARLDRFIRAAPGPVICTCTTLGPAAEAAGAIRIDRPMMQAAALHDGRIVMAYALSSTLAPSRDLLAEYAAHDRIAPLDLTAHWPLFESDARDQFLDAIAGGIRAEVAATGAGCVVLAQASMAGAKALLTDLPCPVLASPELALRAGLHMSMT